MNLQPLSTLHTIGAALAIGGSVGAWFVACRLRNVTDGKRASRLAHVLIAHIAGAVLPGAAIATVTGIWMTDAFYEGAAGLGTPWLAIMAYTTAVAIVVDVAFNLTFALRLRRAAGESTSDAAVTALKRSRGPAFTLSLTPLLYAVIAGFAYLRIHDWFVTCASVAAACAAAGILATVTTRRAA